MPDLVLDHAERQGAAALAPDARQHQRGRRAGLSITAQIAARPVGLLLGLELSRNPFQTHPSYAAIAKLPLQERLRLLRQPEVRAAILRETPTSTDDPLFFRPNYDKMYLLGNPPDYEQPPENTLGAQARRQGCTPEELAYDAMLTDEGRGMLYVPFLNYADGNLDATREMLSDPCSVPGLSDGGAHCGIICDASFPTYLLTHWTRDRSRGERLSIPFVVAAQSRKTALSVGCAIAASSRPATRPTSTSSTTTGCICIRRRSITTFRSAAAACCNR